MKKTGYEIIGMIKDGKPFKKIKKGNIIFEYNEGKCRYMQEKTRCNFLNLMLCLNDEFEIVQENKIWKPKRNEVYYSIGGLGSTICRLTWYDSKDDDNRYDLGNCFKTEEEAEKALEKIKIYTQLKRYAEEHDIKALKKRLGVVSPSNDILEKKEKDLFDILEKKDIEKFMED